MVFCYVGTKTFTYSHRKLGFLAQKRPNLVQNVHFWSFWAKYCHLLHILSNARPKNNVNKVPRWVFRYVGNKTFDFSSKKTDFLPKNDQIWPKTGIFGQFGPGHAGLFSALLVGRLVVVARGLYLARHLFTLFDLLQKWVDQKRTCWVRKMPTHSVTQFFMAHGCQLLSRYQINQTDK